MTAESPLGMHALSPNVFQSSERKLRGVRLVATGSWVPPNVMTNIDIIKKYGLDSSDEWVRSRTGIAQRHINDDLNIATSDMAARAGDKILLRAHLRPDQVDAIFVATTTPDYQVSPTANRVKEILGIPHAYVADLNAGCSGLMHIFLNGVTFIESGRFQNVLLIGADMLSTVVNWKDRSSCFLFSDGAGGVLLQGTDEELTHIETHYDADGREPSLLYTPSGGTRDPLIVENLVALGHDPIALEEWARARKVHMQGHEIYEMAVEKMSYSIEEVMRKAAITSDEVDVLIPHQANIHIINAVAGETEFDIDKVVINIDRFGNSSAGSIGIALDEAVKTGRAKDGDYLVLAAFGAGLNWGAAAVRLNEFSPMLRQAA